MVDVAGPQLQRLEEDASLEAHQAPVTTVEAPQPAPSPARVPPPHMAPKRYLKVRGRDIGVVGPSLRDLRLRLSAVILTLQVLGQTVLRFKVSIAQILVTMAVCAVIEVTVTLWHDLVLAWPASAIQTGASVAFILRASGTRHGDWWSLRGIHFFVIAAVLSLLSKYLIRRPGGRHVFNPSNAGLVAVLLVVGPRYVFSEHLWWGHLGLPVLVTVGVILFGGLWILKAVRMIAMALSFLVPFAAILGVFALTGRSFYATWSHDPVTGMSYWLNIALSPEVIAYVFFMMSDPQTAPRSPLGRVMYGASGAVVTAGLLYFQTTEFGIKLAILSSLALLCAVVPLLEAAGRRIQRRHVEVEAEVEVAAAVDRSKGPRGLMGRLAVAARNPATAAVAIIAVAAPVDTLALVANKDIALIERDLPAAGVAPGSTPLHNPHRQ